MGSPVAFSTNAMKKPVAKWALSAAVGVCVLAGVFVLARCNAMIDFSDNPALLVQVSEAGTVYVGYLPRPNRSSACRRELENELRSVDRGTKIGSRGST